jgi:glycosyltransferase involved in cell wall biosynthesis
MGLSMMTKKLSICFVSPKAYHAMADRTGQGHVGGAEIQQTLIARELAKRGHTVSAVTWDYGQTDGSTHRGVRLFNMCDPHGGARFVRFFHPRWTSLRSALKRAGADVYYQRAAGCESAQVALWCRRKKRSFLYAVASQEECEADLSHWGVVERLAYKLSLRYAEQVVVQTVKQQDLLRQNRQCDSIVVHSCATDPGAPPQRIGTVPQRVLWVGRIASYKRVDRVFGLAQACPGLVFDIVGAPGSDAALNRQVAEQCERMPNVVLHGAVAHDRIDEHYRRSAVLLCTSDFEGFPNTFLEAWRRGVPVVTTWDAARIVRDNTLGVHSESIAELGHRTMKLLGNVDSWNEYRCRVRQYYLKNHTVERAVDQYEDIFAGMREGARISPDLRTNADE